MRELSEVQQFVKAMIETHERVSGLGRFEIPFPDKDTSKILIDYLVEGQHPEYSDLVNDYMVFSDDSDIVQGFADERYLKNYIEENVILSCKKFIDEMKADIEEIEAANVFNMNDYRSRGI